MRDNRLSELIEDPERAEADLWSRRGFLRGAGAALIYRLDRGADPRRARRMRDGRQDYVKEQKKDFLSCRHKSSASAPTTLPNHATISGLSTLSL
jgi:hypothetical protein